MNRPLFTAFLIAAVSCSSSGAKPAEIEAKIFVEATADEGIKRGAPCFIVFPEGEALAALKEAGVTAALEKALGKRDYQIVANESDAAVFIKVDFVQLEPFDVDVVFKGRPTIDYSNSSSTRNYAAMMPGGRYHDLANPEFNRQSGRSGFMIGSNGEPIDIGKLEPSEAKISEGKLRSALVTVHPVAMQISAWQFDEVASELRPDNLWAVTVSYENPRYEELGPQLRDLTDTAVRFIGKDLNKPRLVRRK